jgi:hypothetical protein
MEIFSYRGLVCGIDFHFCEWGGPSDHKARCSACEIHYAWQPVLHSNLIWSTNCHPSVPQWLHLCRQSWTQNSTELLWEVSCVDQQLLARNIYLTLSDYIWSHCSLFQELPRKSHSTSLTALWKAVDVVGFGIYTDSPIELCNAPYHILNFILREKCRPAIDHTKTSLNLSYCLNHVL